MAVRWFSGKVSSVLAKISSNSDKFSSDLPSTAYMISSGSVASAGRRETLRYSFINTWRAMWNMYVENLAFGLYDGAARYMFIKVCWARSSAVCRLFTER